MEPIKFYKLESPYSGDTTLNCDLKYTDFDDNFLAFKNDGVSSFTFDEETYTLNLIKNGGENIKVDISSIKDYINKKLSPSSSSGSTSILTESDLALNLSSDGVLSLSWIDGEDRAQTAVSGIITPITSVYGDEETITGNGTKENPLKLQGLEKNGHYSNVKGIVDTLPTDAEIGDKYVIKESEISAYGVLYSESGLDLIKQKLEQENSLWRIPTKKDWDEMFTSIEDCETDYTSEDLGDQGVNGGNILKSQDGWDEEENLDSYFFTVLPTLYANENKELVKQPQKAVFWVDTEYGISGKKYIREFINCCDTIRQGKATDNNMYSIRLVRDYSGNTNSSTETIFGKTYNEVTFPSINQAWISQNLDELVGTEDSSKKFSYEKVSTFERFYIIQKCNTYWKKKELISGDSVVINNGNGTNTIYNIVTKKNGNTNLVKTAEIRENNVAYDAGLY